MEPSPELVDAIYRDRVLRAREMSVEQKLFAGPRLFEQCCRLMMAGIRHQFPDADDVQVRRILEQRLAIARRLEEE